MQSRSKGKACIFYGWINIAVLVVVKVVKCQGQNNVMAYTVPYLLSELRLSDGSLGTLFSCATLAASLTQPVLGKGMDKLGARLCIPIAQSVLSLTLLCFSAARCFENPVFVNVEVVVLFFFLRGMSLGALETFPGACVQKWFVRRRGRAATLVTMLQQAGNALAAPVVSGLVLAVGWRQTARWGSLANIVLAIPTMLILRSRPEDCGLKPDGDDERGLSTTPNTQKEDASKTGSEQADEQDDLPPGLFPLYLFTFIYAFMFGGCDFEMVGMISEAVEQPGDVDVATHIYVPLALTATVFIPIVGECMDHNKGSHTFAYLLLGTCGLLTFLITNLLHYAGTPVIAISYGILRGLTQAVFGPLLNAGLAFAVCGVHRGIIGRVLGKNRLFAMAGTAAGPLVYGVSKGVLGTFKLSLQISSLPPLLLAAFFWGCLLRNSPSCRIRSSRIYTKVDASSAKVDTKLDSNTFAKAEEVSQSKIIGKRLYDEILVKADVCVNDGALAATVTTDKPPICIGDESSGDRGGIV